MIEDGSRISITIQKGMSFNAIDNINNTVYTYTNGNIIITAIPKAILLNHMQCWLEMLSDTHERYRFRKVDKYTVKSDQVHLVENAHADFTVSLHGKSAQFTELTAVAQYGFNKEAVIEAISWAISIVTNTKDTIDVSKAVVRTLQAYDICIWKYGYNTMVHFRKELKDGKIEDILLNGEHFANVLVVADDQNVKIVNDTGIIAMYPIDGSIKKLLGIK